MEITIRHINAEEDVEAVHEIFSSPSVIHGTMRLPFAALDYTRQRLAPSEGAIRLVALIEEEIAGFAELITYPHVPRHRHVGELNMICVHEDMQGKGIGRVLMEAIVDLADQWLQLTKLSLIVWEGNDNAIRLYEQFGFVIEGTMTDYVFREGDYIHAHMMGRTSPHRRRTADLAYQENYNSFG
jgi:putative acetyltransferase